MNFEKNRREGAIIQYIIVLELNNNIYIGKKEKGEGWNIN